MRDCASVPHRAATACTLALTLLTACGAGAPALRPAYGVLPGGPRESAWARAQTLLRERDDEVALGDPQRGVLVTRPHERDVPCGPAPCRVREVLHLRIEDGRAAVTLERQHRDAAAGGWRPPATAAEVAAVVAEERSVLERLLASRIEVRLGRAGEACSATPDCGSGLACLSRRCVKVREAR
jgi:hypothetical protein